MKNNHLPIQAQIAQAVITTIRNGAVIQTIADLVGPLPVIMLDPPLHTDEHPYCDDSTCPCQDDRREQERAQREQSALHRKPFSLFR